MDRGESKRCPSERAALPRYLFPVLSWSLAVSGCNSFDEPISGDPNEPKLLIPTDTRPATLSATPPPPVSGGTLAVTADGQRAVAADPDRDRIVVVDLAARSVVGSIELEPGDEPGRVALGDAGLAFVALRGGGAVVGVDTVGGALVQRTSVCGAPRGLAYDATNAVLHVACAEGKLVTLPAAGGEPTRTLELGPDLRDVMVHGQGLFVTRFRSAEVVELDATGRIVQRQTPTAARTTVLRTIETENFVNIEPEERRMQPAVAWKSVLTTQGEVAVLHQRAVEGEVELVEQSATGGSSYGGNGGCGAIVQPAITVVGSDGRQRTTAPIAVAGTVVDMALSPDGTRAALASAGISDPEAPRPEVIFPGDEAFGGSGGFAFGGGTVQLVTLDTTSAGEGTEPAFGEACQFSSGMAPIEEPATAVAFNPLAANQLIVQTREPAKLYIVDTASGVPVEIALGGDSRFDTGHELFHRDSGGGIACASCHPEGRDDGHVWVFSGAGERRTQALHVGLAGTAPFHWDGKLEGLGSLMEEVFVGRMGGVLQSSERLGALQGWLFALEPLPPLRGEEDGAVARGQKLFESERTACASCHSGQKLTNNQTVNVGTGPSRNTAFQVPSLVGIAYRAPFMHDGCATTLEQRFEPACGGALHGSIADLDDAERADLIAYLESL
ncbi:MAG TPA: cytochrome c peroxidase [Polyangiaceae bacterium]|jgi:hypothetical protein